VFTNVDMNVQWAWCMLTIAMQAPIDRRARPRRMTFAEATELDPDKQAGELVEGEWAPVTRNTWRHGEIVINVALLLRQYAKQNPGWSVAAGDPGTKLKHDPDVLRGPDVAIVRADRRPTGKGAEGWLEGAPDVAVEIVGDRQAYAEMTKKALEYLAAGAKMVWVIDPDPERVVVFTPPDHIRILGPGEELEGGEALPGFRCELSEIFG